MGQPARRAARLHAGAGRGDQGRSLRRRRRTGRSHGSADGGRLEEGGRHAGSPGRRCRMDAPPLPRSGRSHPFRDRSALFPPGSTVQNNSAATGGGIANQGALNVASSTITSNRATSAGGGISTTGGSVTITDSMINSNLVDGQFAAL